MFIFFLYSNKYIHKCSDFSLWLYPILQLFYKIGIISFVRRAYLQKYAENSHFYPIICNFSCAFKVANRGHVNAKKRGCSA